MSVNVTIEPTAVHQNVLTVPSSAIKTINGASYVQVSESAACHLDGGCSGCFGRGLADRTSKCAGQRGHRRQHQHRDNLRPDARRTDSDAHGNRDAAATAAATAPAPLRARAPRAAALGQGNARRLGCKKVKSKLLEQTVWEPPRTFVREVLMKLMIEVKDITKTYGYGDMASALKGVSFVKIKRVRRHHGALRLGQVDEMMHILGCLDTPTSGTYHLDGKDVSKLSDEELAEIRKDKIGFVFQSFNLLPPHHRAAQCHAAASYTRGRVRQRGARGSAKQALIAAGMVETRFLRRTTTVLGGQIQRVAIARALVMTRRFLADEPTGNLDTKTGEIVLGTFRKIDIAERRHDCAHYPRPRRGRARQAHHHAARRRHHRRQKAPAARRPHQPRIPHIINKKLYFLKICDSERHTR